MNRKQIIEIVGRKVNVVLGFCPPIHGLEDYYLLEDFYDDCEKLKHGEIVRKINNTINLKFLVSRVNKNTIQ